MARNTTANSEVRKLRNKQKKLVSALQALLDLLEAYAPRWYTQEHHDVAFEALAIAEGNKRLSVRQRSKRRIAA